MISISFSLKGNRLFLKPPLLERLITFLIIDCGLTATVEG